MYMYCIYGHVNEKCIKGGLENVKNVYLGVSTLTEDV